ncbi:uncharacterized protein THITE_133372 [Thermothielavioides terrestris NRRL 8126]|uniref:Uncharacterized protein n=1 Tax=Thermothielavioides terrestris (strain ATCC 38088 / NRRL 8126) TaxID=578455 RepID=G2R471_THETT|nr:uncharacterized protein THITE_133372 [Thermothielavioides terrestris NRRL 8126]AEO65213.1 hypothetical protein THITE_133372 [Thermothielavioides terrestris NRRL 8126]
MLRRRSLKSTPDLRRRKSTSSTRGVVLEHINPALAQRDAHIAAWEAYSRAQSRATTDMSLFPPPPESSPCRLSERSATSQGDSIENDEDLRRRQSVRFVGPCFVPPRRRNTREGSDTHSADGRDGAGPMSPQRHALGRSEAESAGQPASAPRRAPLPVSFPKIATGHLDALAAGEEYYTLEDDIASAPSSYRRLHRSRSMWAVPQDARRSHESGQALGSRFSKSTFPSMSASRRFFRSEPTEVQSPREMPTLRAPKSMSFLTHRTCRSRSSTSRDESTREPQSSRLPGLLEDGSAVIEDKARRPRYKSSTLFGSRSRRTDLKLRKSLRSSSTTEDLAASSSGPLNYPAEQKTLSLKTRKASMSLRLKIKNFFSGTKPDEGAASIPCQHIESQRSRVTVIPTPSDDAEAPADQDREVIRGPPARVPSLQIVSPGLVHSSRASVVSLKSERDRNVSDGSSLTSWVHSGPSTLTSQEQQQWREWERQRLSIIRENGARTPSTSLPRQPHGSGLFQPPESAAGRPVASRPVVDSQRIYSALVKRMHALGLKMKEKTAEERSEAVESDRSAPPKEHPDRSASNTPDTIRRIRPGRKDPEAPDSIITPTCSSKGENLSRFRESWDEKETNDHEVTPTPLNRRRDRVGGVSGSLGPIDRGLADVASGQAGDEEQAVSGHNGIFAQDDAQSDWRSRVVDSPASYLFRTASSYRRALRKSMQEEQNAWAQQSSASEQDSDTGTQVRHSSQFTGLLASESNSAKDLDYAESIYSSDDGVFGSALPSTPAMYRAGGCREASAASSIEWKTWLSANIGKFEPSPTPSKPAEAVFGQPTMPRSVLSGHFASTRRHVREQAQIHDEDDHMDDDKGGDVFSSAERKPALPAISTPTPLSRRRRTTTTTAAAVAATRTATPLSQLEPNVLKPPPPAPPYPPPPSPLRRSTKGISPSPSTATTATTHGTLTSTAATTLPSISGAAVLTENESPTRPPPPPPPVPPRSKLRPEPLRIVRPSLTKGQAGAGAGSDSMSLLSSPGLSEAVLRQFGPVSFHPSSSASSSSAACGKPSYGNHSEKGTGNWRAGIAEVLLAGDAASGDGDGEGQQRGREVAAVGCDESVAFL